MTGQIIHGEIEDLTGVEALNNMLCLPGGSFHLLAFTDPGRETISGQWEFLLMEAARVRDETLGALASADPSAAPDTLPDAASIEAFSINPPSIEPQPAPPPTPAPPPSITPEPSSETAQAETTTGM